VTREEFADLLERLVEDGEITLAEAEELASRYEEFADLEFALAPEQVEQDFDDVSALVLLLIGWVLARMLAIAVTQDSIPRAVTRLSYAQRVAAFSGVQDLFQAEVTELATDLARGQISITSWQQAFNRVIVQYYRAGAELAFGSTALSAQAESLLRLEILRQQAFLSRFADVYSLSVMRGEPFTEGYLQLRSQMYAGGLRALSYRIAEISFGEGAGWVVQYIAVDDDRTCSECADAMISGPYLLGSGPMPGEVCLGRSRCRCRREVTYDPQAYAALVR
jgi:hypothetical protein